MNKKQQDEISRLINVEIIRINERIMAYTEESMPIAPENAIGRLSRMDAINNKSISEAALSKAQEKLAGLKYILSKVGASDFGVCERCKNEIPVQRILAAPHGRYCVYCAF